MVSAAIFYDDLVMRIKSCIFAVFSMRGCRMEGIQETERQGDGEKGDRMGTEQERISNKHRIKQVIELL